MSEMFDLNIRKSSGNGNEEEIYVMKFDLNFLLKMV